MGITEDWEQRKLGELVGIYDGVHQTPDYQDSGIMFLSVENIATLKSEKYISEEAFERDYKVYPEKGDILMTRIGDVGTTNVVETAEKVAFYVSLALLKPNEIDSYFLSNAMKTNAFQKGLRERTLVTAIPQKINKDEIGKIDIFITNNDEEQKKIGAYFSNLDHLITLHQRKCEQTKTLKKYMLQKMFPQDGEKVPQIRFEGFTEDWEQRKFKELCDMVTVGIANSATHAYSDSGIVMFRNQNIKPNFLDDTDIIHINPEFEVKYKNKRLRKNDLLVARTGYPGTACVVPGKYENSQTFTTLIARPKKRVNSYFLCQYLNSDVGVKYFESTQIGGGQKNSGAGILNEMPVTLPPAAEEEKRIADFFTQLDHLITLHQRKCDELKEVKKFMLQNIFV